MDIKTAKEAWELAREIGELTKMLKTLNVKGSRVSIAINGDNYDGHRDTIIEAVKHRLSQVKSRLIRLK